MQGVGVLRQQTEQFIDENPSELVLMRGVKADDGAGGSTSSFTTLSAQRVRIVPVATSRDLQRENVGGKSVTPEISILGMHDLDIKRGDQFEWQGLTMEVVWLTCMEYACTAEASTL